MGKSWKDPIILQPVMRCFNLIRHEDVTGVSGTGVVAEGVVFQNGKTVISWLTEQASVVVWDRLEDAMAVHSHGGKTVFQFLGEEAGEPALLAGRIVEPGTAPTQPYDPTTEQDPLIRKYIVFDVNSGEALLRGFRYPVWAVVLNLLATGFDRGRVHRMYYDLDVDAIEAAARFWHLHPDDILSYLE